MSPASPQVGTPFSALSAHRNRIRLKHPLDLWGERPHMSTWRAWPWRSRCSRGTAIVMLSRVSEMESTQIEQASLSYHRHVVLPEGSGVHLRVEVHARRQPAISLQIVSDAGNTHNIQRTSGSGGSGVGPGEGSH